MEDWAVVIGITAYPGLKNLEGPERDARDFFDWVTSADGGGIDPDSKRAHLVVTSKCVPPPPYETFFAAEPTMDKINRWFMELYVLSLKNQTEGKGRRIGRRLYLYLAGHGFTPQEQVALLTANSMEGIWGNHIPGTAWADWFYKAGLFDEILLFMDCCRDYKPGIPANPVILPPIAPGSAVRRRFYAYASDWGQKSWEQPMPPNGEVHGVFTTTLMRGLRGAACDRLTGDVTTSSLRAYLKETMRFFFSKEDQDNSAIRKDPHVPDLDNNSDFTITHVATVPTYEVNVLLPSEFQNKPLQLITGFAPKPVPSVGTMLSQTLPRGSYMLMTVEPVPLVGGFNVMGIGKEDVTLQWNNTGQA